MPRSFRPKRWVIGVALLLLATACSAGSGSEPDLDGPFAGSEPAPEFPAGPDWLNTGGRPLQLAQLGGKVVALHFWSPGCIGCLHSLQELERLAASFSEELVVIGVSSPRFPGEAATETVRRAVLRHAIEHPVINDAGLDVWKRWGVEVQPTVALVDPAGNVVGVHRGEGVDQALAPVVASLAAEFAGELDPAPIQLGLEREGLPSTVLSFPGDVAVDAAEARAFIADTAHHRIVVVALPGGEVLEVFGGGGPALLDGTAREASFARPHGVALAPDESVLYVADTGNHALRVVDLASGRVRTIAGTGTLAAWPPEPGTAPDVALRSPWDVAVSGETLFVAMAGSNQLWSIDLDSRRASPSAGSGGEGIADGHATDAELSRPGGLALGADGRLYFTDPASSTVRWHDPADASVGTLAGAGTGLFTTGDVDGVGSAARMQLPLGLAVAGDRLLVADSYNHKVKAVAIDTGEVTTRFGSTVGYADGTDPRFNEPAGVAVVGTTLYVADSGNHALRIVDLETSATTTLVLKGIEQFQPTPDDENFRGTRLELPAVDVAAGPGTVVIDFTLPSGHKVNDEAPSSVAWTTAGGVVTFADGLDTSLTGATFPVSYPVILQEGTGSLTADVDLFWCAEDAERLCFIEQVRLRIPLRVGEGTTTEVRLPYDVVFPEIP